MSTTQPNITQLPTPTRSNVAQFGIKWQLTISTTDGQQIVAGYNSWLPEGLQITFDTYQTTQAAFWYADIAIYNLNDPTTQVVLKQGMTVKLEAGYQVGPFGTIFEGTLFQPMWEREDGIDYKLTLHCLVGLVEETNNFVSLSVANGLSQRDLVARMASNCIFKLNSSNVNFPQEQVSSRGEVIFGQPGQVFKDLAEFNGINYWASSYAANIRQLLPQQTGIPTLQYSPQTGLIGTPQQTQDGVDIRVLLDPRATLATQYQLSPDTVIRQLPRTQGSYPTILDQNGLYVIAGVRHIGDSRGNTWDTEITGYTYIGSRLALLNP